MKPANKLLLYVLPLGDKKNYEEQSEKEFAQKKQKNNLFKYISESVFILSEDILCILWIKITVILTISF